MLIGTGTAHAQSGPPQAKSAQLATDQAQSQAVVDSPLRSDADRRNDARRKPAEFLAFAQVGPGMKALDFGSSEGRRRNGGA